MKKSPQKPAAARPAASRKAPAKKVSAQDAPRLSVKLPGIWFSKSAARKARNAAQGKASAKPASKAPAPAKKAAPAKPAPKKPAPPARKAPAKKSPPVKPSPKKAPAKKAAPAKKPVKMAPPKKGEVKKPEVRKPVKKVEPKKAPVKKVEPKKAPVKKVEPKKAPVKKDEPKKVPVKKDDTEKSVTKKDEAAENEAGKKTDRTSDETTPAEKEPVVVNPEPLPAPEPDPDSGLGPISPPVDQTGPSTLPPEIVPLVASVDDDDLFAEGPVPAPQESAAFTKKDLAEFRAKLLALRSRHSGKAASLQAQSLTRPDEVNPEEDGTDASMRITEISKASIDEASVNDIDTALRAIDAGTYGVCQNCGGRIAKARLRALPFAKNCAACQSEMEQDAARRRAPPTADYYG